jgi:hypothetical protein
MLANNDVATILGSVRRALVDAETVEPPQSLTFVNVSSLDALKVNALRASARLGIEFDSGSARPFVGPIIRAGKKVFRRGIQWYIRPIADQQSKFNLGVLDLMDRQFAAQDRLDLRLTQIEEQVARLEHRIEQGQLP